MSNLIKGAETILIFSGEGENGTYETYTGKRTQRAIKSRLTEERCEGDRWAQLWVSAGEDYEDCTYLEINEDTMEPTGDMRTLYEDDIDS